MAPISKRRKLSDLTSGDTNELLNKIEEFRSILEEGDEDLPDGLIEIRSTPKNCATNWKTADQPLLSTLPSPMWIQ
ncbi:hypothetical protein CY34DRAFT_15883 [Suillus luteus UH-Slu-Lm8-n1]|uniref:Uncharacterized protein n=1 Tax=Suillus luteus UH-Slu-Lm8-n1 TaxID=930992 RepID=A0A0C9ZIF5_9AGAM|nr:hypothetical protein CY34DRAFT_15883 [Suillus luteus UH-Slu-Lm8-n1]